MLEGVGEDSAALPNEYNSTKKEDYAIIPAQPHVLWRCWLAVQRIFELTCLFSPLLLSAPQVYFLQNWFPTLTQLWYQYGIWAVETSGPTFVKLAQWASSRPDLFSPEFCKNFSILQDNARQHSWAVTDRTLSEAFGNDWREHLALEKEPVGSGCIAQVHRGTLSVEGKQESVAVKVLHPGVENKVAVDMSIMLAVGSLLEDTLGLHYLSVRDYVESFAAVMAQQLDLRIEARNLGILHHNFRDPRSSVVVPRPFEGFVTDRVLVEQFIDGVPILKWSAAQEDEGCKQRIAKKGLDAALQMIFKDKFLHLDMHAGNVMITHVDSPDKGPNKVPMIALLDAGLVLELTSDDHRHSVGILGAFFNRQGYVAGERMLDASKLKNVHDADAFCRGVADVVEASMHQDFFSHMGEYVSQLCQLACHHRVKIEHKFLSMCLAVKLTEGMVLELDPAIDIISSGIPILASASLKYATGG